MRLYRAVRKDFKKVINKFKPSKYMHKPEGYYFAPSDFTSYAWGRMLFGLDAFTIYEITIKNIEVVYALNGIYTELGKAKCCKYRSIKLSELTKEMKYGIGRTNWNNHLYTTIFLPEIIIKDLPNDIAIKSINYTIKDYQRDMISLKRDYDIL